MTVPLHFQPIAKKLAHAVETNRKLRNAFLLVHSASLGLHWATAHGQTAGQPVKAEQPFHTASIGKTFTAVLIAMLAEEGKLDMRDPIAKYLPDALIEGLHVYKGKDYSREIRIDHLLGHTSGLADFYEQKVDGKTFMQRLFDEPDRAWTPQETIEWTKRHMPPRFAPGKGCHYTDTGFNLLGLIIERVTGKPYHDVLHERIFDKVGMRRSYLLPFSEPRERSPLPVASIVALGREIRIEELRSVTSFYASGGTVSTAEDLLAFMKALVEGRLVSHETLAEMQRWRKLWIGVDYGFGLHRVRMLPFVRKFDVWGHLGSIGSFMLYNPTLDAYVIGTFNSVGFVGPSLRFALGMLQRVARLKAA